MYSYKKEKLPKNTSQLIVEVPKADIKKKKKRLSQDFNKNLPLRDSARERFQKPLLKNISIKTIFIKNWLKNDLPYISRSSDKRRFKTDNFPKVDLVKAKEGEDWQIKITVAEKPTITLGDYKKLLRKLRLRLKNQIFGYLERIKMQKARRR